MRFLKKISFKNVFKWSFIFALFLFVWANIWVHVESKNFVFQNAKKLPSVKVGLLLGTSRSLQSGNTNPFFEYRVQAAYELYRTGKIKHILISGDNSKLSYNEPEDLKNALLALGVPACNITLDFAGFDTYDSVIRANKIFGQTEFIVISQEFHVKRAVYIGRRFDLGVWGYCSKDVSKSKSFLTHFREYFARVKAYLEVKLNVDPHFLGEKLVID